MEGCLTGSGLGLQQFVDAQADVPENDRLRYTICEAARLTVLSRLARLNQERWQAEQDALAEAAARQAAITVPRIRRPRGRPRLEVI